MHVNTKRIAFSGVMLAVAMLLAITTGILNFNSLFFYVLAGFIIGFVIRTCGMRYGSIYLAASVILGFFIASDKVEVLTFVFAEIYIIAREAIWLFLSRDTSRDYRKMRALFMFLRWLVYQGLLIPMLLLFPDLFFTKRSAKIIILAYIMAQIFWYLCDYCYNAFMRFYEERLLKKLDI